MNKTIEIEIPEGKRAEWKEVNGVTTLVLIDEKENRGRNSHPDLD